MDVVQHTTASSLSSPFRADCLAHKVAVVTGGASGIGYGIVTELLAHGVRAVVLCGRRLAFMQHAVGMLRQQHSNAADIQYQVCDVRNYDDCARVAAFVTQQYGGLDILVNGAAGNFLATAEALRPKGLATVLAIDAQGTFHMTRACHAVLKDNRGGGIIINISATLHYGATYWQSHASAAKAAVDALTRSWALEWGSMGIRVVGIAPGPIADTPGTTKLAPGLDAHSEVIRQGIPLGRLGTVRDIGLAVVYLSSSAGAFVSGTTLVVDGGQCLHRHAPWVPRDQVEMLSRSVEATSRAQQVGPPGRNNGPTAPSMASAL